MKTTVKEHYTAEVSWGDGQDSYTSYAWADNEDQALAMVAIEMVEEDCSAAGATSAEKARMAHDAATTRMELWPRADRTQDLVARGVAEMFGVDNLNTARLMALIKDNLAALTAPVTAPDEPAKETT